MLLAASSERGTRPLGTVVLSFAYCAGECGNSVLPSVPRLHVPVRDSKVPHGPVILVGATAWAHFVGVTRR